VRFSSGLGFDEGNTWLETGIRIAFQRSEGVCGMNGKGNGA